MHYREFTIKKRNGKHRRICAPTPEALAYQRSILPTLTAFFIMAETQLGIANTFHGFIKNRNCVTAAKQHIGMVHTISLDISSCFDSIQFDDLGLDEIENPHLLQHADGSLAQGFATSPILANIYLLNPILDLKQLLNALHPGAVLTCYADDLQISLPNQLSYDELNYIITMATLIFAQHKLTINSSKTHIHHAKFGHRRILGIQVGETELHPNRRLKKKIRAARFQRNGPSLGGLVTASRLLLPKALR